jgi:hypothetical protein
MIVLGLGMTRCVNEHMEHPQGAVVFQHACKMGLEGYSLEAPRIALPIGPLR